VACDGTWQSSDSGSPQDPTNVTNLCRALAYEAHVGKEAIQQIVLYQAGVGTGNLTPVQHLLSGGMGLGLEENSREAYAFIADNYSKGDETFLFGFSRGAYTARSIAGLIGALGVLTKGGMPHFKPIYNFYEKAETTAAWASSLADYISSNKLDGTEWRAPPESKCFLKVTSAYLDMLKLVRIYHLS
jgi:uncharacterized protein (DUF2235 family)